MRIFNSACLRISVSFLKYVSGSGIAGSWELAPSPLLAVVNCSPKPLLSFGWEPQHMEFLLLQIPSNICYSVMCYVAAKYYVLIASLAPCSNWSVDLLGFSMLKMVLPADIIHFLCSFTILPGSSAGYTPRTTVQRTRDPSRCV